MLALFQEPLSAPVAATGTRGYPYLQGLGVLKNAEPLLLFALVDAKTGEALGEASIPLRVQLR